MITIIITSYNEPKATKKAVETFLKQSKSKDLKVIVVDPFPEVEEFLRKEISDKRFDFIPDPGEGKSFALNMLFEMLYSDNKNDLIIFTDGDVYVSDNALKEIINTFKDEKIGCITGQPVAIDSPDTKYGFWAKVLFKGVDKVRNRLSKEGEFFQTSGYLFAIRNSIVKEIPEDVPEDCIIPYLVWKAGYKIGYVPEAKVFIKYPDNWKDWLNQRIRVIKAHENISKIAPDMPRTKSFFNEIKEGLFFTLKQPRNLKQAYWLLQLYFARLYIYYRSFKEMHSKKVFNPAWRDNPVESSKMEDKIDG
ncbi:MAG: glycosyltransferase family 2 protein [Candidatus Pacearchaeota archaeon]